MLWFSSSPTPFLRRMKEICQEKSYIIYIIDILNSSSPKTPFLSRRQDYPSMRFTITLIAVLTDCWEDHGFAEAVEQTPYIYQKWVLVVFLSICTQSKRTSPNDIQRQALVKTKKKRIINLQVYPR